MKKRIFICSIVLGLFLSLIIYYHLQFNYAIPVLAYHDVVIDPINETDVSVKNFEKQMKLLHLLGYKTLSLDELKEFKDGKKISGKKIVLTFDDGNKSFYTTIIPILEKYNFKAVNFVIDSALNKDNYLIQNDIKTIKSKYKNFDIQSHSYNLHNENSAISNNYNIYNEDMNKLKDKHFKYYAYPFGINNDNYINALKDNNYKMAFLFNPSKWTTKKQDDYKITRVPIYKSNSLLKFFIKISIKF